MVAAGAAPAALADASNSSQQPAGNGSSAKRAAGPAEAAGDGAPATPAKGSPAKGGSPRRGSCTLRELCPEDKVCAHVPGCLLPLRHCGHFYPVAIYHQLG